MKIKVESVIRFYLRDRTQISPKRTAVVPRLWIVSKDVAAYLLSQFQIELLSSCVMICIVKPRGYVHKSSNCARSYCWRASDDGCKFTPTCLLIHLDVGRNDFVNKSWSFCLRGLPGQMLRILFVGDLTYTVSATFPFYRKHRICDMDEVQMVQDGPSTRCIGARE